MLSCGRIGFASQVSIDPDAHTVDSSTACVWGPFGTPVNATWLNTEFAEYDPTTTVDGLTIFFTSEANGNQDILSSTSDGVNWSVPQPEVVTTTPVANSSISTDGLTLYSGISALARSERAAVGAPWSPSIIFFDGATDIESPNGPDISVDDLTLYFSAFNSLGTGNLFTLTRATPTSDFSDPQPVPGLPSSLNVDFPAISTDELELFFGSGDGGPLGTRDIYVVRRATRAAPFGPAENVVEVNSDSDESDAEISTDGTTLWFASTRPGGAGDRDIYFAVRACL